MAASDFSAGSSAGFFFLVLGDGDFVAFRGERRGGVFGEGDEEDALHIEISVVPLGVGVDGAVVAGGGEEEPLAVVAEVWRGRGVGAIGDGDGFFGSEAEEHGLREGAALLLHVGDPLGIGRPAIGRDRGVGILGDGDDGLRFDVDVAEALLAVAPEEFLESGDQLGGNG